MNVTMLGTAGPPRRMGLAERLARSLAWFMALLCVSMFTEVAGHAWALWPTREGSSARVTRSNWVMRHWGVTLFRLTTGWLRAGMVRHGSVPEGRYVVVSNHQSTADIAILLATLPELNCKFVAKRELGMAMPAVSMALARMGSVLISRQASRHDVEKLREMGRSLEYWQGSAVVFAEGTRSRDGRLLPYRTAALRRVAEEAKLPLLPVALDGTHVASDLPSFIRSMPGARVAMWIGEPIPVERWSGRLDEAVQGIRAWATANIDEGRRSGLVPPPAGWSPEEAAPGGIPGEA